MDGPGSDGFDQQRLIEDLQQHQEELQQQNDELRRTYDDLNVATQRLRDLWNNAPVGYVNHSRAGVIFEANERARNLLEATGSSISKATLQSFLTRHSQLVLRQHLWSVSDSAAPSSVELQLQRESGDDEAWVRIESTVNPLAEFRTALIDISAQKKAEQERLELASQLRQAQKMELLHELSGGIAHDFNNLLQVIMATAELIRSESVASNRDTKHIDLLLSGAQRGADLTSRLLAFSRKSSFETRPTDLKPIIEDVHAVLRRTVGDHTLVEQSVDGAIFASIDENLIQQAIMNLCVNARDAMPLGGRIYLCAFPVMFERPQVISGISLEPGQYCAVAVADDGIGMSTEMMERVFEPFYTTKEKGSGTGLGLSIVYGIALQHGGAVDVESTPGQGSQFTIYLPCADPTPTDEARPATDWTKIKTSGSILLAEDEPQIREVVSKILNLAGYSVVEAHDGRDAIGKLSERQDFDLLLTDARMPHANGSDVCEAFHRQSPQKPVVFLTGHGDGIVDSAFLQQHNAQLLSKPLRAADLLTTIGDSLEAKNGQS